MSEEYLFLPATLMTGTWIFLCVATLWTSERLALIMIICSPFVFLVGFALTAIADMIYTKFTRGRKL